MSLTPKDITNIEDKLLEGDVWSFENNGQTMYATFARSKDGEITVTLVEGY